MKTQQSRTHAHTPAKPPFFSRGTSKPRPFFQAKLDVGTPGDRFEREADSVADQVTSRGTAPPIQRMCSACAREDQSEERLRRQPEQEEEKLQAKSESGLGGSAQSGLQTRLRSSEGGGSPLPRPLLGEMNSAFGADFGAVRLHTGGQAAEMNRDLHAKAFTHGRNIYFNQGNFAPDSSSGKRLLAHELTHVVQQGYAEPSAAGSGLVQPQSAGEPELVQRDAEDDNFLLLLEELAWTNIPEDRVIDRMSRLTSTEAIVFIDNDWARDRCLSAFDNDEMYRAMRDIPHVDLHSRLSWLLEEGTSPDYAIEIILMSSSSEFAAVEADAEMMEELNDVLNYEKEINGVETQIDLTRQLLERQSVCGPDITGPLNDAVALAETRFGGWSSEEKHDRCLSLWGIETGAIAWDIDQLYNKNHRWILSYRPNCATEQFHSDAGGADELCGNTVEVNGHCFYAGSPNYVIFGKMMKLCHDFYSSQSTLASRAFRGKHTLAETRGLVNLYKGSSIATGFSASSNFRASLEFAENGYNGSNRRLLGDRPGCFPVCPSPYKGPAFTVRWSSYSADRDEGIQNLRDR